VRWPATTWTTTGWTALCPPTSRPHARPPGHPQLLNGRSEWPPARHPHLLPRLRPKRRNSRRPNRPQLGGYTYYNVCKSLRNANFDNFPLLLSGQIELNPPPPIKNDHKIAVALVGPVHFLLLLPEGYHVHCKKAKDYMPQESGSIGQAGLKLYVTFH